jgi:hypothetical protein
MVCHKCGFGGMKWVLSGEGSKGQDGLVSMRQLILSMGLVWMEVRIFAQRATRLLPQVNRIYTVNTTHVLNIVVCAI